MAKLLFDLRNVPDDEADEVRQLLQSEDVGFYETRPSAWGLFAGGLWITDEARLGAAKALIAQYQAQRRERARAEYAAAVSAGTADTFWSALRREPAKVLVLLVTIILVVGLTVMPYVLFGD